MRREDFPPLKNRDLVYLDSACMSLRPQKVIKAVEEYYREYPACPGRSHHSLSEKASERFEEAREKIAGFIGAEPENLVLTSGTTEGINTVASSFPGNRVFLSDREHNSNLVPWQEREDVEKVFLDTEDGLDTEKLEEKISEGDIVSLVHVSNLDGKELPLEKAAEIARENNAYTLVDGAQSVPHQPVDVSGTDIDFLAFSGHKMLGPSGTGALYVSERGKEKIEPLKYGGGAVKNTTREAAEFEDFPQSFEPGLPNVAGVVGFGAAVEYLGEIGMEKIRDHEEKLTRVLEEKLDGIEGVEYFSEGSGVVSFWIEGMDSHQVALMLDRENIAVRSGMHCVHSWFDEYVKRAGVRASFHLYNEERDVEKLVEEIEKLAYLA
ncbi:MAG: aminotransferase class V-fold PLP-dependent enzyme [Candidatus Nanosalina sp.]